jgi:uncharacterized protein (TIGR03083 family)
MTAESALHASVDRLRSLVGPLDDAALLTPAYPSEWTIADVLSHLGSGAVIMQRRLDDGLRGEDSPDDFAPSVWDTWNARDARAKADDGLAADRTLIDRIDSVGEAERETFGFSIGPMEFDFPGFVALRVNEHVLHTWDVEVTLDPTATLPADAAAFVVDRLDLIARFTGAPTGSTRTVVIQTHEPDRRFVIELTPEAVTFGAGGGDGSEPADLELSAESMIRLVYGRLDAAHSVGVRGDEAALDELRRVYPGP